MLLDLDAPGVSVRPLHLMTGDHEVNQVFFDNVEVTPDRLLGAEGEGWTVARYLLEIERGQFVFGGRLRRRFQRLVERARRAARVPRAFWDAAARRRGVAGLRGDGIPPRASRAARGTGRHRGECDQDRLVETMQRIDTLALMVEGPEALHEPLPEPVAAEVGWPMSRWLAGYFNNRAASIYGGSNEVQRELVLRGLKRRHVQGAPR